MTKSGFSAVEQAKSDRLLLLVFARCDSNSSLQAPVCDQVQAWVTIGAF